MGITIQMFSEVRIVFTIGLSFPRGQAGRQCSPVHLVHLKLSLGRSHLKNELEDLEAQRVFSFLLFTLKKLLGNSPSPFLRGRGYGEERFYGTTWRTTQLSFGRTAQGIGAESVARELEEGRPHDS